MGRRTLSRGFCRKVFGEGRLRFVVATFLLMIVCTLGLNVGDSGVADDIDWKSASKVDQGSNGHFHRTVRRRIDPPQAISTTQSDRIKARRRSIIGERQGSGTNGADRKEIYRPKSLSKGLRRLANSTIANGTIETWEETGLPVDINATAIEEALVVEFSRAIVVSTILLGAIAVLLSIASSIFVYWYRKNVLVAIGQPPFLYLVCFGSLLLSSELFFLFRYGLFVKTSIRDATCIAQLWLRNIGSVCVHMALFCKLWRAYKVAQFRKSQVVLPKHVIGPFLIMMVAVIAVTIAQTIVDPPVWQVREDPSFNHVAICLPRSMDFSSINAGRLWVELTTTGLQFLSLALMLVMAYITRNIPEDISDSKRVFQAVISNIVLMVLTASLFWVGVSRDKMGLSAFSRTLRYFFDAIIYVGLLVVPKILGVWSEKRRTTSAGATPITVPGRGQVHVNGLDSGRGV